MIQVQQLKQNAIVKTLIVKIVSLQMDLIV
jgi:hypothetical protein